MGKEVRVAVIGGGNMGVGVLYHLARAGWTDILLLEKAELTSGATWHAAGLVSRMVGGYSLGAIHDYAVDFYKSIEKETGQSVSYHGCGSIRVATSPDHEDWLAHIHDAVSARGQDAHIISAQEFSDLNPLYDVKAAGISRALYTPDDGHVDPAGACLAMAKGARSLGAKILRNCRVTDVRLRPDGDWDVVTEQGCIRAEHVVNAGGYHARQIGQFSGLDLPITTMQHHYVVTDDVPAFDTMAHEIPVTRDDYFCGYLRREQKSVLIGLYDKQAPRAVWLDGCPWDSENELFEPNLDGITPWLENCFERCPELAPRGIKRIVNGGISYTPDGAMLLGPAPGLRNYWLACGATVGIAWGPGAGRTLAEWMVLGASDLSTRAWDPRRFGIWADADYAKRRATEDYTLRQAMPYPQHQRQQCRDIKRSGAHHHTTAAGALYEEAGGWERPRLYAPEEPLTWRRTTTFDIVGRECAAVRERVGLGDFSAFAKFKVEGPGAESWLEAICANNMPGQPGGICLTLFLNHRGTIEGEAVIVRRTAEQFYIVTGAPSERRLWDWLVLHCGVPVNDSVSLDNLTDQIGILTLAGPDARQVLGECTDQALDNESFPWRQARNLNINGVACCALRLSFTGELAYEIHADNSDLGTLWQVLWRAGEKYGIGAFGSRAIDALRLEKAYRGGHELTNDASPKDADMMRFVSKRKSFVGKDALKLRDSTTVVSLLQLENPGIDCLGGEAVFFDDELAGSVTSAAYAYTIGRPLVMAYLKRSCIAQGSSFNIRIFGELHRATLCQQPPWDPDNRRLVAT